MIFKTHKKNPPQNLQIVEFQEQDSYPFPLNFIEYIFCYATEVAIALSAFSNAVRPLKTKHFFIFACAP